MSLTIEQRAALKAYIDSTPALTLAVQEGRVGFVAQQLNLPGTKIVWRTAVGKDEITQNGFDWTRLDNLSVGKARVWDGLFDNANRSMNPAKPNVRAGVEAVWVGTAADLAVRAAVYVHCKRPATIAEGLLASGLGTTVEPATMAWEGEISPIDLEAILAGV